MEQGRSPTEESRILKLEPLSQQIMNLPEKTGVYIFKGRNATLYVGKAANIKKRVQNHLQSAKTDQRENRIIESSEKVDYIVTDNETDALIEENILIKSHKPRYNVRLSDDKTYPYIKREEPRFRPPQGSNVDLSRSYANKT